jgi:hypothetical protein
MLPPPGPSFDREGALHRAREQHALVEAESDTDQPEKAAYDAALGSLIVEYLDSLPKKDLIRAHLELVGESGIDEGRFLKAQAETEAEREELLRAAKELLAAGELRRVRRTTPESARILWLPGPQAGEPAKTKP